MMSSRVWPALLVVLLVCLGVISSTALPHSRLQQLRAASAAHALLEQEAAGAATSGVLVGEAGTWQHVLAKCGSGGAGCGFAVLAQLYDELYASSLSPWVVGNPLKVVAQARAASGLELGAASKDVALARKKVKDLPKGSDTRAAEAEVGAAELRFATLKARGEVTRAEVEARVDAARSQYGSAGRSVLVPGLLENNAWEAANRFTYKYDSSARLRSVRGYVLRGPGSAPSDNGMCSALWEVAFGGVPATVKDSQTRAFSQNRVMDVGHVVGAQLGGANGLVINFFPQIGASNRGAYYQAENFAAMMRDYYNRLNGNAQKDCVEITITYSYPEASSISPNIRLLPKDGHYQVTWNLNCVRVPATSPEICSYNVNWSNDISRAVTKAQLPNVPVAPAEPVEGKVAYSGLHVNLCDASRVEAQAIELAGKQLKTIRDDMLKPEHQPRLSELQTKEAEALAKLNKLTTDALELQRKPLPTQWK